MMFLKTNEFVNQNLLFYVQLDFIYPQIKTRFSMFDLDFINKIPFVWKFFLKHMLTVTCNCLWDHDDSCNQNYHACSLQGGSRYFSYFSTKTHCESSWKAP